MFSCACPQHRAGRQGRSEAAQGKARQYLCRHLNGRACAGKEKIEKQAFSEMITREWACLTHFILILDFCSRSLTGTMPRAPHSGELSPQVTERFSSLQGLHGSLSRRSAAADEHRGVTLIDRR